MRLVPETTEEIAYTVVSCQYPRHDMSLKYMILLLDTTETLYYLISKQSHLISTTIGRVKISWLNGVWISVPGLQKEANNEKQVHLQITFDLGKQSDNSDLFSLPFGSATSTAFDSDPMCTAEISFDLSSPFNCEPKWSEYPHRN